MIRITVWNEDSDETRKIFPDGMQEAIADILREEKDFVVRTASLRQEEAGLTEDVLKETDVLFWWGHMFHDRVPDEVVERVQKHVLCGMGLVVLHSGHHSKIFKRLCGTNCSLKWHDGARERVFVVNPSHPIAKGLPEHFVIPNEECYCEPFGIPEPDSLVFLGWYNTGEVFRSGCCFYRENGRIFYFQPGHESDSSFKIKEVGMIYKNAARWAADSLRVDEIPCPHAPALEE